MEPRPANKRNLPAYLNLALQLVLAVVGLLLFFATGLNSDAFLYVLDPALSCLPFFFAFPVFIILEFASFYFRHGQDFEVYALPCKGHEKTVRNGFFIALPLLILGLVLFFINKNNVPLACVLGSVCTMPANLSYLLLCAIDSFHAGKGKRGVVAIVYLVALVAIEVVALCLSFNKNENLILLYGLHPLLCLCMSVAGRKDA